MLLPPSYYTLPIPHIYTVYSRITVDEVKILSHMEEEYQVDLWGVVEGGHDMDRLNNIVNLSAVITYWNLYHGLDGGKIEELKRKFKAL